MEFDRQLKELGIPYGCLVAFSGTVTDSDTGKDYTENSMNGLRAGTSIPDAFKSPKYRILIVSNKFQTGYDEPLLHSMYVDKPLRGLQCVQTLSRLNRMAKGKTDTFVLDFVNTDADILESFQPYYQKTVLKGETDPNRLYTLETDIRKFNILTDEDIQAFCEIFYDEKKDQTLFQSYVDKAVQRWSAITEEDEREDFRSLIQSYIRLYGYISQIVTFEDLGLEKLYVFLRVLNKKLPKREKTSIEDITSLVDLYSFRMEQTFEGKIFLKEEDGQFDPIGMGSGKLAKDEDKDTLSQIINSIKWSILKGKSKVMLEFQAEKCS
jgi:type I restriction enzyme R subunit